MQQGAGPGVTRRTFLGTVAVAPLVATAMTRAAPRPIRLGGPIFLKSDDPVALAKEHRRLGYSAAYCPAASPNDSDKIRAIREAFKAENVVIAEVGAWRNMLDPDAAKRAANLTYVTERLALARPSLRAAASTSPARSTPTSGTAPMPRTCRRSSSIARSRTAGR